MFSPKELEGEVDHSFFDSAGEEDGRPSKDREKRETGSETGKPGPEDDGAHSPQPAQTESSRTESSRTETSRTEGLGAERADSPSRVTRLPEEEERILGSGVEDESRTSSVSSLKSEPEVKDDPVAEEVASIRSRSFVTAASSAEDGEGGEDDEDGYHQSEDESDEEEARPSQKVKLGTPKKNIRKHRRRSPSPSSSETDTDSCDSAASDPRVHTRPRGPASSSSSSSSSPVQRPGPDGPTDRIPGEDSDDTVTDVTPLSTPDDSPVQSLDLDLDPARGKETGPESGGVGEKQDHQDRAPPSSFSTAQPRDEGPAQDSDQDVLGAESQLGSEPAAAVCPGGRNRKNYSFTNDEVRSIDRENQRLLRQLSGPPPRPRPGGSGVVSSPTAPPLQLYHSARNRQREQQRIERENLAFLRRLESVKPTPGMRRAEQLADYQRQARFLGISGPLPPLYRCSSRTSSGKSTRPSSSIHCHGTRAAFATPTSPNTISPGPRATPASPGLRATPTSPGPRATPASPGLRATPASPGARATPISPGPRATPASPGPRANRAPRAAWS